MNRRKLYKLAIELQDCAPGGATQSQCAGSNDVEDRLQIAWRPWDYPQDLRCCCLLLERLVKVASKPFNNFIWIIVGLASSRRRRWCLRAINHNRLAAPRFGCVCAAPLCHCGSRNSDGTSYRL